MLICKLVTQSVKICEFFREAIGTDGMPKQLLEQGGRPVSRKYFIELLPLIAGTADLSFQNDALRGMRYIA